MATIGQPLTEPEAGWRRLNDDHPSIEYIGTGWTTTSDVNYYNGDLHYTSSYSPNTKIKFEFVGSGFRYIGAGHSTHSTNVVITIDGVSESFSQRTSGIVYQRLDYEKTGLQHRKHTVEVYSTNSLGPRLDAIDIYSHYRTLILLNEEYKMYNGSEWETVTTSTPTEQDFLDYGMDVITMLDSHTLSKLNSSSGNIEIVCYTATNKQEANLEITANYSPLDELDDPELLLWTEATESKELRLTAVPRPKLVMPLRDLDIKGDLEKLDLESLLIGSYTENIIPKMTSNTTPSGEASASSYNGARPPWHAFDGTANSWLTDGKNTNQWLSYKFASPKKINKYAIKDQLPARLPNSWRIEGSNDGQNWIVLDSHSNVTDWIAGTRKEFIFTNEQSFFYYRIFVIKNNGDTYISIASLEFMSLLPIARIRTLASGDQGSTWKTFKQNTWKTVDISNLINVKNNGMTADEVNSLTREDWLALNPNQKIRLAYYLEQENSTDTVEINFLSSVERITTSTPTLNSLTIIYDELDKKYSGLIFMDTSEQYYSTSFGEILKYLDMRTLVAGQTSLDVKVKLTNTYPFDVKNIRLWSEHDIEGLTVEFSKSVNPFIAEEELIYEQQLNFDEVIEFYIRLSVDPSAQVGGNFDIRVSADPV